MSSPARFISLRSGYPDFQDLPWDRHLQDWRGHCTRLEEVPQGLSRHPLVFVAYGSQVYALKELPSDLAKTEYDLLCKMEELRLPVVTPVGYALTGAEKDGASVLITRYLEHSLPYRSLFMRKSLDRYRDHLLDAMAILLVQLHLAGAYWGDCSLSNTLFRRDAGTLQAYLVDAETAEVHSPRLSPTLRLHDLEIMEEHVGGDLIDLRSHGLLSPGFSVQDTALNIRQRYQRLWDEITREQVINPEERYRIQERIRALNALGFSVGEVEIKATKEGDKLLLRALVTDRNFHRDQLLALTGIEAEEMQARQMMNEILELKATLSRSNNRSTPLSVAAYHWLERLYQPVVDRLRPVLEATGNLQLEADAAELYCQVLEHKWFLSERAKQDVGHNTAVADYLQHFGLVG